MKKVCLFVAAVAVFLAFYGATKSFWLDESYSVWVAEQDFFSIIASLKNDTHPPLYYFLLALWTKIFGASEFGARSLSGVFYLATVAAVYFAGTEVCEKRGGLLAAFLYALSPLATGTANSARMYSLLGFLAALSTLFFIKIFLQNSRSKFAFWCFGLVNALGTLTQIWFFFLLAAQIWVYLILIRPKRRREAVLILVFSLLPFAVLWAPMMLVQMGNGATGWLARPGLSELIAVFLGFYGERIALVVYAALLLLLFFNSRVWNTEKRLEVFLALKVFFANQKILAIFLIFLLTILIPFFVSQFRPVFGQTRYAIVALPAFVLLLASLLSSFAESKSLLVFCFLLLTLVGFAFVRFHNQPEFCSDRNVTEKLLREAVDGDVLIYTSLSRLPTEYYLKREGAANKFIRLSFPSEIESHPGWRNEENMLADRSKLETEAAVLIENLQQSAKEKPRYFFLFYGLDRKVTDILKQKLDREFVLKTRIDATCAGLPGKSSELFYTEILVYRVN